MYLFLVFEIFLPFAGTLCYNIDQSRTKCGGTAEPSGTPFIIHHGGSFFKGVFHKMTQRQLNDFAQSRGLVCLGRTLAGAWDGWPFFAAARSGRREVLQARISCARGPLRSAVRAAQLPAGCRLSLRRGELRLTCRAGEDELFEVFRAAMDAAVGVLEEGHAVGEETCALCGEEDWDSFALMGSRCVPVHAGCCAQLRRRAEAEAALSAAGGNYITGWLGALAGGLAGLVPTALTLWFRDVTAAWLCLLVPLGAYFGYKLCRGRMDRMAVAATVVSSLVQVFLLEQLRYYRGFVEQGLVPLVFASVAHYFTHVPLAEMLTRAARPLELVTLGDVCVLCMMDAVNLDRAVRCAAMEESLTERESAVAARVRRAWAEECAPTAQYVPAGAVPAPGEDGPAPEPPTEPEEPAPEGAEPAPPEPSTEPEEPAGEGEEPAPEGAEGVPVIVEYEADAPGTAWTARREEPPL